MIQIICQDVLLACSEMTNVSNLFLKYKNEKPDGMMTEQHCPAIIRHLKKPDEVITRLKLTELKSRIEKIKSDLELYPYGYNFSQVYTILHELNWSFVTELRAINFAFIPTEKLPHFEQGKLFGKNVFDKFPKARDDIKSAGNCLATDLYDATVFHLMLVMNNGLLALAKHIAVPVEEKPLEYLEWHTLIGKIDTKLGEMANAIQNGQTAGTIKDADLDFYQGLLDNLKYTKDAHRNPITHARGNYDESTATAVFNDVRRFMERLATRVSE
jgi:hypothetical protein